MAAVLQVSQRPRNELLLSSRVQTRPFFTQSKHIKQVIAVNISLSGLFFAAKRGTFLMSVRDPNHKHIKIYLLVYCSCSIRQLLWC